MNKKNLSNDIIEPIITLIIGLLLIAINGYDLTNILFLILGIIIIIFNLQQFIGSCKNLQYKTSIAISQFIENLLIIVSGVLLIIFQAKISNIIGYIILVFIIIQIIQNIKNWQALLIHNLTLIIISILLIVFSLGDVINVLLTIIGIVLVIISILYFLYIIKRHIND